MAIEAIERLHYYQRQYLGAEDFEAQQAYHRDMRRRHNLAHHTWGIVVGMELVEKEKEGEDAGVDVYVCPGMAVDGFGREIIVTQPYKLDPVFFDAFIDERHREVWIAYDEERDRRPAAGYELCDVVDQFRRVRETFRIVVEPRPPTHDSVVVAGKEVGLPPPPNPGDLTIPPDESVPYQEFPDDDTDPRWLVRLGSVHWDGANRKFVPLPTDEEAAKEERLRRIEGRHYVGAIAEEVMAPAAKLLIRDRHTAPPLQPADDGVAVTLEGSLQVDRLLTAKQDVQVHGGSLDFRDSAGDDGGSLFTVHREEDNGLGGIDLRVKIGEVQDGKNRFAVGPEVAGTFTEKLAVRDDGQVRIDGDLSISGVIDFDDQLGDRLMLWGAADDANAYGLGIESGTLYAKAHTRHRWYVGANADGGASARMTLDNSGLSLSGRIDLSEDLGDRLMLWGAAGHASAYGLGIESGTLYAKAHTRHRWYVGANADGGASDVMELTSAGLWLNGRLKISGIIDFFDELGDRLMFYRGANDPTAYGFGIESGTLYAKANQHHRWYIGANADGGGSARMTLSSSSLEIKNAQLQVTSHLKEVIYLLSSARRDDITLMTDSDQLTMWSQKRGNHVDIVVGRMTAMAGKAGYIVERFINNVGEPLEQGDVVVLSGNQTSLYYGLNGRIPVFEVDLTDQALDTRICGIVDEILVEYEDEDVEATPISKMQTFSREQLEGLDETKIGDGQIGLMVTLGAYAHCKVDADIAPIEVGDLLTTSPTRGHAQKLHEDVSRESAGAIIGKALGALSKGKGKIPVLVTLQ